MTRSPPRIVLDTNAGLDLWVFSDPRASGLRASLHQGAVHAVTNRECRDEWRRVLGYPQLQLDDAARVAHAAAFDTRVHFLPDDAPPLRIDRPLPRCADPDDQKFLQLALTSGARWLVSRDRDLLALAQRVHRLGLFEIVSPQAWSQSTPA